MAMLESTRNSSYPTKKTLRLCKSSPTLVEQWHKRCTHLNFQRLCHRQGLITKAPQLPLMKYTCASCMMEKPHKERIPKQQTSHSTRPLEILYLDLLRLLLVALK